MWGIMSKAPHLVKWSFIWWSSFLCSFLFGCGFWWPLYVSCVLWCTIFLALLFLIIYPLFLVDNKVSLLCFFLCILFKKHNKLTLLPIKKRKKKKKLYKPPNWSEAFSSLNHILRIKSSDEIMLSSEFVTESLFLLLVPIILLFAFFLKIVEFEYLEKYPFVDKEPNNFTPIETRWISSRRCLDSIKGRKAGRGLWPLPVCWTSMLISQVWVYGPLFFYFFFVFLTYNSFC